MKVALSHERWSRRIIHGTCDTFPKMRLHPSHNFVLSEPWVHGRVLTQPWNGVSPSQPHRSGLQNSGGHHSMHWLSADWMLLLDCRSRLWGLVGFYNNYQGLISIQLPLNMMCYILRILLTRDNLSVTFWNMRNYLAMYYHSKSSSPLSNSKHF